jgi:hypothetical protein
MDIAALFIVGIGCALVGGAVVRISAQIEQRRAMHQLEKYGAPPAPNTSARNGEPGAPETDRRGAATLDAKLGFQFMPVRRCHGGNSTIAVNLLRCSKSSATRN